jgi:hypothetical protein
VTGSVTQDETNQEGRNAINTFLMKRQRKLTAREAIAFCKYTREKRAADRRKWYAKNHEKALQQAREYRERKKAELSTV